jgi:predicted Zn-dependent peptidase
VEEAVKVICREYKKIREERVNQKELEKAKENLRGRLRLGLETSDQFAHFLGEQELLKDKIQTPEQKWQEIAKVTPGDILKVARQIFRPERLNLALIGPQPSQELLKSLKL